MAAHPTGGTRWIAHDQGIIRHVLGHHRAGGDKGVTANGHAAHDRGIGADGASAAEHGLLIQRMPVHLRAGIGDVGQHAGRPKKYIVLHHRAGINRNVVLNFDVVAHVHIVGDIDVLAQNALLAQPRPLEHMREMPDFCAGADVRALVHQRGFMDKIGLGGGAPIGGRQDFSSAFERALAGIQHGENTKPLFPVSDGRLAALHALEELTALGLQGLGGLQCHDLGLGLDCRGHAVFPFHLVRIKHQLVLGGVIEHGHLVGANHHEALFLKGVKPAHKDMGSHAVPKDKLADGDIADGLAEVFAALAGNLHRHFVEQSQHDGDVVWRKAPEDVFLGADFSDVQSVGIHIFQAPQRTFLDQRL